MKIRSLFLTVLLTLSMFATAVSAQDIDSCFGLSTDDCDYIAEASANGLGDAESFTIDVDIDFTANNIPAGEDSMDMSFNMVGALDLSAGEGFIIPVNMAGSFDVTASQAGDEMSIPVEILLVDDVFYFQEPESQGWFFVDLVQVISNEDVSAQLEDLASSFGDLGTSMDSVSDADLEPLVQLLTLPGLLNYERDGEDFTFTIDLTALQALLDPDNEDLLNTIIDGASQADPTLAFMIPAIPALIETGTIEVVQSVNPDLMIVENYQFNISLDAQLGAMTTGDATAPATEVNLAVNIAFGNFDGVDAIEAPADATDVTQDFIDGFIQGASGF